MSQKKVAEELGYAQSTYCDWENGKIEPSLSAIKKICILFNISADELLGLEHQDPRPCKIVSKSNDSDNKKMCR